MHAPLRRVVVAGRQRDDAGARRDDVSGGSATRLVAMRTLWKGSAMRHGEIRYAKADEHHIAFQELVGDGRGGHEIVMVNGGFWPMQTLSDDPIANRLLEGLAGLGRLIVFDRRGVALSDPVSDWDTPLREQWAEDLAAVIVAAECDRPTVFSWQTIAVARTCAARHPELIGRMVLWNPAARVERDDMGWVANFMEGSRRVRAAEDRDDNTIPIPGRRSDPAFRAWNDAAGRAGASPSQATRLTEKGFLDPPFDNASVATPTLVITRVPPNYVVPEEFLERTAHQIPGAQHVALPAGDAFPFGLDVDDVIAEISQYVTGEVRLPPPERQIAVILFTDLVGSTRRAESVGDAAWKRLLDRHDEVNRTAVSRQGGQVITTTGDGVLALLPSPTAAIHAAQTIRTDLRDEGLEVRIAIHLGEVDRRGNDISGLAVNIASRIMASAEPGQILVAAVVAQTTNAATFTALGPRTLRGVDGSWDIFAVE